MGLSLGRQEHPVVRVTPQPCPISLCVLGELVNVSVHSELDNMAPSALRKPSVGANHNYH